MQQPVKEIMPEGVTLRDPEDFDSLRQNIFDEVKNSFVKSFPVRYGGYRMEVEDVDYEGPDYFDFDEQNKSILEDRYLARKLRGTVKLISEKDNQVVDAKRISLMRVPYLTERGTFVYGGNDYSTIMQARLLPGIYTRRQANGHIETQVNPKPGTGQSFRIGFEPETAQYRLKVQQANLHLYSLLHDLGVPDEQLEKEWGSEILEQNKAKYDARVFDKAFARLVRPRDQQGINDREGKIAAIRKALDNIQVHERVTRRNLPNLFDFQKAAEWRAVAITKDIVDGMMQKDAAADVFEPDLNPDEVALDVAHWFFGEDDSLTKRADFDPDLTMDEMREEFNNVVGKVGPRLASMKAWPSKWLTPNNPLGWLSWYRNYSGGVRGADDAKNIQRWKSFKARQLPLFKANPTPRRAFALRNWAIDPMKYLESDEDRSALQRAMDNYRADAAKKWVQQKAAAAISKQEWVDLGVFLNAEFGAGINTDTTAKAVAEQVMNVVYGQGGIVPGLSGAAKGGFRSTPDMNKAFEPEKYVASPPVEEETYDPLSSAAKQAFFLFKEGAKIKTYGVDLDGTLAQRFTGDFDPEVVGDPVEPMLEWVKGKLDDGHKIVIFTARADDEKNIPPVRKWLKAQGLGDLPITNRKTPDIDFFVDDKAIAIKPDTGESFHRKLASSEDKKEFKVYRVQSLEILIGDTRDEKPRPTSAKRKKVIESEVECCPWCDYEFPERGGMTMVNEDTMTFSCNECGNEFDTPELTDEEIEKVTWGGDEFKVTLREQREKRRELRKKARLSYDHARVEEDREKARQETQEPKSKEQAEAGNYKKGKFWWNGLQVALENPKGSMRRDWHHEPPEWKTLMTVDYGYVKKTMSEADGDHVDVFCGPDLDSGTVYVVDQYKGDTFDEHKCCIGFKSEKEARDGYLSCYSPGWKGLKAITSLTVEQFKDWVKNGDTSKPLHTVDVNKMS